MKLNLDFYSSEKEEEISTEEKAQVEKYFSGEALCEKQTCKAAITR